jgi:methyl-accepting chemotaxis protein
MQLNTRGAVQAIAEIGTIIAQINQLQGTIAAAVEEQSVTTNEISRNVAEAARGTAEIVDNIGAVSATAQNTRDAAGQTQRAAEDLARVAAELQGLVDRFKYDRGRPSAPATRQAAVPARR